MKLVLPFVSLSLEDFDMNRLDWYNLPYHQSDLYYIKCEVTQRKIRKWSSLSFSRVGIDIESFSFSLSLIAWTSEVEMLCFQSQWDAQGRAWKKEDEHQLVRYVSRASNETIKESDNQKRAVIYVAHIRPWNAKETIHSGSTEVNDETEKITQQKTDEERTEPITRSRMGMY